MPRSDLDTVLLADLEGGPDLVVLCPTARVAAGLRRAHGEAQVARGRQVWAALGGATPAQWLDHLVSSALLRGEIPAAAMPGTFLTRPQELCLWQQAVTADAANEALAGRELFDREGLALAAMEAHALQSVWRIDLPRAFQGEETRAFLRWRDHVAAACRREGWVTAAEAMAWRIDCVARGIGGLPARVGLHGFIVPDPVFERLLGALEARGVRPFPIDASGAVASDSRVFAGDDAEAECRAAADWARRVLASRPEARLRIAVADWAARWRMLESALENALHPEAVGAGWAAWERCHAVAGGTSLDEAWPVAVALDLLRLRTQPQRIPFAELGPLLRAPGWAADVAEADARARLEAALRESLPPEFSLERLRRAVRRDAGQATAPGLLAALDALAEAASAGPARRAPGAWGGDFTAILARVGWPGQHELLPAERAAADRLGEMLAGLATLDAVVGRVDAASALRLLRQACRDHSFAPPRRAAPAVEICTLDEALAGAVDGLWVMGLNEGAWPPAPRPNPLLPAELQRRAGVPEARGDRLADLARRTQAAWRASAPEVILSWARREGERELRPSPLLAGPPDPGAPPQSGAGDDAEGIEVVADGQAPPMDEAELARIRGGTALLQAQALCPAWGFHQFRLGARALPAPVFGLDTRVRGGLLHAALAAFWRGRGHADLLSMEPAARAASIAMAIDAALDEHARTAVEPLSPRLAGLERERLAALLETWLDVEAQRGGFRVLACEERHELVVAGLPVRVVVDRVDQLADGRLAIIDYKSGRSASADSWADVRIGEPQLPIYAALAFPDSEVAAVALARVVPEAPAFVGVASDGEALPGVKALEAQRGRYAEDIFPDWAALRRAWAERIAALAAEVVAGHAETVVADEAALAHCEVRPLLRLAERRDEFERE